MDSSGIKVPRIEKVAIPYWRDSLGLYNEAGELREPRAVDYSDVNEFLSAEKPSDFEKLLAKYSQDCSPGFFGFSNSFDENLTMYCPDQNGDTVKDAENVQQLLNTEVSLLGLLKDSVELSTIENALYSIVKNCESKYSCRVNNPYGLILFFAIEPREQRMASSSEHTQAESNLLVKDETPSFSYFYTLDIALHDEKNTVAYLEKAVEITNKRLLGLCRTQVIPSSEDDEYCYLRLVAPCPIIGYAIDIAIKTLLNRLTQILTYETAVNVHNHGLGNFELRLNSDSLISSLCLSIMEGSGRIRVGTCLLCGKATFDLGRGNKRLYCGDSHKTIYNNYLKFQERILSGMNEEEAAIGLRISIEDAKDYWSVHTFPGTKAERAKKRADERKQSKKNKKRKKS